MTTDEALALIDQVLASVPGTRSDHQRMALAVATIKAALEPAMAADPAP